MLQGEHSAILLAFIKLQFVIKIFVFSIFELPLKTGLLYNYIIFKISYFSVLSRLGFVQYVMLIVIYNNVTIFL